MREAARGHHAANAAIEERLKHSRLAIDSARSLRGIFEEMITPILYQVPLANTEEETNAVDEAAAFLCVFVLRMTIEKLISFSIWPFELFLRRGMIETFANGSFLLSVKSTFTSASADRNDVAFPNAVREG